jgi:peptide/nickel transport system substrate-binding protein
LDDYARDAEVQNLLQKAGASADPEIRRNAFSEAIRLTTERAEFVPLFSHVRYVAHSKQLTFEGFQDDLPRFYLSTWK